MFNRCISTKYSFNPWNSSLSNASTFSSLFTFTLVLTNVATPLPLPSPAKYAVYPGMNGIASDRRHHVSCKQIMSDSSKVKSARTSGRCAGSDLC